MATHEFDARFHWIELRGGPPRCGGLAIADAPFPPRPQLDITELTSSVRLHGVLCPLLIRRCGDVYEVVAGWSRLRAARNADLVRVAAIERDLEDAAAIRSYLSTKAVRKALTPEAQQKALRALKDLRAAPRPDEQGRGRVATEGSAQPDLADAFGAVARARLESDVPQALHGDGTSRLGGRTRAAVPGNAEDGRRAAARQLCSDTEELFFEVLSTRHLDSGRVEEIVDRLLELAAEEAELDLEPLYGPPRDAMVAAHSVAVALLAAHMARSLGWSKARFRQFVVAAFLHDVGMVFLEGDLRVATDTLDRRTRETLPRHVTVGFALIEAAGAWNLEVARCARDHHERWDGSGYPQGRRGGSVSFAARLLAYLDTFAALVSPRPHRPALPAATALLRLKEASEAGKLDPELLTPVIGLLSRLPVRPAAVTEPQPSAATRQKTVELGGERVTMPSVGQHKWA